MAELTGDDLLDLSDEDAEVVEQESEAERKRLAEELEEQFIDALAGVATDLAQLHESLGDAIAAGDPERYIKIKRRLAAWQVVLGDMRAFVKRTANSFPATQERTDDGNN